MAYEETPVVNIKNKAVTEYANYPFNSFCLFNGKYFGAKGDGIFELTGADDNGTPINGSFTLPTIDAGKGQQRIPRDAWIAGRKGLMEFKAINDEGTGYTYSTNVADVKAHEERVKIGRGIKGRFFSFVLTNISGNAFDISVIRILVERLKRPR